MTWTEFVNCYSIKLTKQQTEAVQSVEGPTLLLAVPGSGKTTVLVTRLGYMIKCCQIDPKKVLTVTYTVAATHDLRKRYQRIFGVENADLVEFRTINGICAKIIRSYERRYNREAFQLITDDREILTYISNAYRMLLMSFPTENDIRDIRSKITFIKNMMLSDDDINELYDDKSINILEIYKKYQEMLNREHKMDYDDQMVYAYAILKKCPDILAEFQNQYEYICVDEAQDTSKIQHRIIELLSRNNDNLFMVGDEDQSIYGFRAAYPDALLSFQKNHPKARILLMEHNFRSDGNIVSAADRFIQLNKMRYQKHMVSEKKAKERIEIVSVDGREEQYKLLIEISKNKREELAVLYRDNDSALPIIDQLDREKINFRMKNHDSAFFSNRIVVDILNIINFSLDPRNADLFLNIYYKVSSYLKKEDAIKAVEYSEKLDIPILDAVIDYLGVSAYVVKQCRMLKSNMTMLTKDRPRVALNRILQTMGYKDYLTKMKLRDNKTPILNLIAEKEDNLAAFLARLDYLEKLVSSKENNDKSYLILSTIHSSKGLEYEHVVLIDVIDGIFPDNKPENDSISEEERQKMLEEERRVFYVGITRAKDRLTLIDTGNESSFLNEFLSKNSFENNARNQTDKKQKTEKRFKDKKVHIGHKISNNKMMDGFEISQRIEHRVFGNGTIIDRDDDTITVKFDNGILKRLSIVVLLENHIVNP